MYFLKALVVAVFAGFNDNLKAASEIKVDFLQILGFLPTFEIVIIPIACMKLPKGERYVLAMRFAYIYDIGRSL